MGGWEQRPHVLSLCLSRPHPVFVCVRGSTVRVLQNSGSDKDLPRTRNDRDGGRGREGSSMGFYTVCLYP